MAAASPLFREVTVPWRDLWNLGGWRLLEKARGLVDTSVRQRYGELDWYGRKWMDCIDDEDGAAKVSKDFGFYWAGI